MNDYISMWLDIIENMNNDNTYKLAWGRAIVEIVYEMKVVEERNCIHFENIAEKMLKYYWNQVFFFNLKQSSVKVPVVVQETEKCIEYYKESTQSTIPVWFDKAQAELKKNERFYTSVIRKITNKLPDDVSWRFMNCKSETLNVYELDRKNKCLYLTKQQIQAIKDYAYVLSQLLNYKWAQLLEKYNNSPRITSKVKGISEAKLRRNSLAKYKKILLAYHNSDKIIDFYTGDTLSVEAATVDHVIPWSFMYSDDIWNMVLTSRSTNSSKSNHIPDDVIIERLIERNKELLKTIKEDKYKTELQNAIEEDYVHKFYIALKM